MNRYEKHEVVGKKKQMNLSRYPINDVVHSRILPDS